MASATWAAFHRAFVRWESEKIHPGIALRNAAGVTLPLVVATMLHQPSLGLVMALGALNVSYSDGVDPFPIRVRRMLLSCLFSSLAVLVGGLAGQAHPAAIVAAMIWAFGAGLVVTLGQTAADLGTISLVTLVVFAARPLDGRQAVIAAGAALCGGLLQTALSFVFSPAGLYQQDLLVMASIFAELSRLARSSTPPGTAPLSTPEFTRAADVLRTRNRDHGSHAEMFNALLSQAERMRLRLLTLGRLRRRLARDPDAADLVVLIEDFRQAAAEAADSIRLQLENPPAAPDDKTIPALEAAVQQTRQAGLTRLSSFSAAAARDAVLLMDSIAGQLRAAFRMTHAHALTEPWPHGLFRRGTRPSGAWASLFHSRIAVLRANLSLRSVAFRHAVRLAVCIALGEILSNLVDWQRSYWIPMTIAIVLKPDFLSTFSRGALRLAGTFAGLIVATAIYRFAPLNVVTDTAVVGAFTLLLRWWGPANYGLLTLAVSAIVVALIAGTGIAPHQVILLRGINTCIGGILAMLAYTVWPTWERAHLGESLAALLDAYRTYLREIRHVCAHPGSPDTSTLDRVRQEARVARTNAEASADRLSAEPASARTLAPIGAAMLATSHNFIYSAMSLETGILDGFNESTTCLPHFEAFLTHVDLMLYFLAATLRGASGESHDISDLRERFRTLSACLPPNSLIQVETDRMTNALNTLRDQVTQWKSGITPGRKS